MTYTFSVGNFLQHSQKLLRALQNKHRFRKNKRLSNKWGNAAKRRYAVFPFYCEQREGMTVANLKAIAKVHIEA